MSIFFANAQSLLLKISKLCNGQVSLLFKRDGVIAEAVKALQYLYDSKHANVFLADVWLIFPQSSKALTRDSETALYVPPKL